MSDAVNFGKCPKCGKDLTKGQYGPYCTGKCGFTFGKAFGKELSDKDITDLLAGKEILLNSLISKKTGNAYSMFVKSKGLKDYQYTKKDGTMATGTGFDFETRFPKREENTSSSTPSTPVQNASPVSTQGDSFSTPENLFKFE